MGNQGSRHWGIKRAIKLKLDESPEQLDAPDEAISGNQWQSVEISGNHRLPNSTMLLSPLAKPRGPTIREGTTLGDLPWAGKPVRTLPPRNISEVGALRHDKMRRAIRAHHGSSDVIRCHQRSSEVIRGHQRSSEVIRGHQRSSEAITPLESKHPPCTCLSISTHQCGNQSDQQSGNQSQSVGISRYQSLSVAPDQRGARVVGSA